MTLLLFRTVAKNGLDSITRDGFIFNVVSAQTVMARVQAYTPTLGEAFVELWAVPWVLLSPGW